MPRKLLVFIFCATLAFGADEIRRPTADNDPGSQTWSTNACGIANYFSNTTSGGLAYDAAGQSTNVDYARGGGKPSLMTSRQFTTWQSSTQTYTSLTLNFATSSAGFLVNGGAGGQACLLYSLNGGSTWTTVRCDNSGNGWSLTTDTVTLSTSQSFSQIRVGVCVIGKGDGVLGDGGADDIRLYDLWTDGVYAVTNSGGGNTTRAHRPGLFI